MIVMMNDKKKDKSLNKIKTHKVMKINILCLTIALIFIISCGRKSKPAEETEVLGENVVEMNDQQYKTAGIQLGSIVQKEISNEVKVNGKVIASPKDMVSICANYGGYIKNISVQPGSKVSKGETIATIENAEIIDLQQDYLESKAKFEYQEAEFNRQKELYKGNVSSQKNYQQIVSDYKCLKIKVNALEQKLGLLGIDPKRLQENQISKMIAVASPCNGYIKTVNVNQGKFVNNTEELFEIINTEKLILELTFFEKDISTVNIGQKIHFYLPDEPAKSMDALIYLVGKAINDDKTIQAYATPDNLSKNLVPGMYVKAMIETTEDLASVMPDDAVVSFEDKSYIFIFKGKRIENNKNITDFQMIEIKKGTSHDGYTRIELINKMNLNGLKVVIKGAYNLLSALKNAGEMSC
jgi:membrane fusion protein, heavy metal efflux system